MYLILQPTIYNDKQPNYNNNVCLCGSNCSYSLVMVHYPIHEKSGQCCYNFSANIYRLYICQLQGLQEEQSFPHYQISNCNYQLHQIIVLATYSY